MNPPYRRVGPNECRLLFCIPGGHDRDLRFKFVHTTPSSTYSYTALSYTWGQNTESKVIWIDGRRITIRPNLWASLHILQRSWQYIWADAVCINQADLHERNQQVRIMEQIYQNAQVVSVWLGEVSLPAFVVEMHSITLTENDDLEMDPYDWSESMDDLANRPYWSRTWVIQEFLLARAIHLYCSNTRVDVDSFTDMLGRAAGIDTLNIELKDLETMQHLVKKWRALPLIAARHVDRYPELYQPLYDLLVSHRTATSTDPKDKVFALLGLLIPEERSFLMRCLPDYKLSMEQVQIIALSHLIQYPTYRQPRPLLPILQALGIRADDRAHRLLEVAQRIDYLGDGDLVNQIEHVMEIVLICSNNSEIPFASYYTFGNQVRAGATSDDMLDLESYNKPRRTDTWRRALNLLYSMSLVAISLLIWKIFA